MHTYMHVCIGVHAYHPHQHVCVLHFQMNVLRKNGFIQNEPTCVVWATSSTAVFATHTRHRIVTIDQLVWIIAVVCAHMCVWMGAGR